MNRTPLPLTLAATILLAGCASTPIQKVRQRSNYDKWTDEDQRNADSKDGVRFYMARPYLAVHTTFPVDARAFLLDGQVSADGASIRITGKPGAGEQAILRHLRAEDDATFPSAVVFQGSPAIPGAQGDPKKDEPKADNPSGKDGKDGKGGEPKTGRTEFEVRRDINTVGFFPLRQHFDLVYLPDFDEQYVVEPRARFGQASAELAMGPGHVLTSFRANIDNSAITGPILDTFQDLLKTGSAALKTAMGMPPAAGVVLPGAQGSIQAAPSAAGTSITLRAHLVKFAVPGIYALLKPGEFATWRETYPPADGYMLVGGFVIKTYESLVVERLLQDGAAGRYSANTPSGGRGDDSGSGPKKLTVEDEGDLRRVLDIYLRNAELAVSEIVSVVPEAYGSPFDRVVVKVAAREPSETFNMATAMASAAVTLRQATATEFVLQD